MNPKVQECSWEGSHFFSADINCAGTDTTGTRDTKISNTQFPFARNSWPKNHLVFAFGQDYSQSFTENQLSIMLGSGFTVLLVIGIALLNFFLSSEVQT